MLDSSVEGGAAHWVVAVPRLGAGRWPVDQARREQVPTRQVAQPLLAARRIRQALPGRTRPEPERPRAWVLSPEPLQLSAARVLRPRQPADRALKPLAALEWRAMRKRVPMPQPTAAEPAARHRPYGLSHAQLREMSPAMRQPRGL